MTIVYNSYLSVACWTLATMNLVGCWIRCFFMNFFESLSVLTDFQGMNFHPSGLKTDTPLETNNSRAVNPKRKVILFFCIHFQLQTLVSGISVYHSTLSPPTNSIWINLFVLGEKKTDFPQKCPPNLCGSPPGPRPSLLLQGSELSSLGMEQQTR